MKTANAPYVYKDSNDRIREILDGSDKNFEELHEIPDSVRLTFNNGFYVNCAALFVDIRGSSELPDKHTRPVLGKIYRAYISECVAVMNANPNCREIYINGDCVSGIFNTPTKSDIDAMFSCAARLNTLIKLLNWRLEQKGYTPIRCGIGLAYGRALMLKAGYKTSKINDIVWMGDVVNEASNLCHQGNKGGRDPIQVSPVIFANLTSANQKLLSSVGEWLEDPTQHEADLVDSSFNEWIEQRQAEAAQLTQRLRKGVFADLLDL